MTSHLFVFARIEPKREHFADAKAAILDIVEHTRAEPGCRQFWLHEADGCLFLYEEWTSQAALDSHYAQPYTKAVFAKYENWLAAPPEITKLNRLD